MRSTLMEDFDSRKQERKHTNVITHFFRLVIRICASNYIAGTTHFVLLTLYIYVRNDLATREKVQEELNNQP